MHRTYLYLLLILILTACGSETEQDKEPISRGERYGGVFSWNESEDVRSIFPLSMTTASAHKVIAPVYEGLVAFSPEDLSIVPALAESWEMKENGRIFEFTLREGVVFHDDACFPGGEGRGLMAEDVAWCLHRLCNADQLNQMFWLFQDKVAGANEAHIESIDMNVPDLPVRGITADNAKRTVTIELIDPHPGFLNILAHQGCWIYPREFVEHYGPEVELHAVGTGPFKVRIHKKGEVLLLEENEHYWGRDESGGKLPYLDAIRVTFESKVESEIKEFLQGNLSMVDELPLNYLDLLEVNGNAPVEYKVSSVPSMVVQFYCFNTTQKPFNDVRVRKAIAMAIDKRFIVDSVLKGKASMAAGGIVPALFKDYPEVKGIPFNPEKARALLAEAGYPNGQGFPVLTLQFSGTGFGYVDVANAIQRMVKENLGLRVPISTLPSDQYFEMVETGGADFWREGWLADHPDPENFLAIFYGKNAPDDPNERTYLNTTRFRNAEFDTHFNQAAKTTDRAARYALYAKADQVFIDQVPAIPLYSPNSIRLVRSYVNGLEHNGMEMLDLKRTYFSKVAQ